MNRVLSSHRLRSGAVIPAITLSFLALSAAPASADPGEVLIFDPAGFDGGAGTARLASWFTAAGKTPVIASPALWSTLTTADFASYDAIAIPDPTCFGSGGNDSAIAAAIANAATWGAAVDGNVIVIGTDEVFHFTQGGDALMDVATDFVVAEAGKTGAYISLSCYYHDVAPSFPLAWLGNAFGGTWTARGVGCFNDSHIVATHPALAGLTDATLSNWSCSVHEGLESWPLDFEVLAIAENIGSSYTAPDGTVGTPYIVARGVTVISEIVLSPEIAVNPVGTSHTVTALVTTDDPVPGTPVVGTTVTFTIIAGPHVGATDTDVTDVNGEATFTYVGTTTGTDLIEATFVDGDGHTQRSNRVEKQWVEVACYTLDFDTDDEGVSLVHGQHLGNGDPEFDGGSVFPVTITSSEESSGLDMAAILNSTTGPALQDCDLLVGTGNILILQIDQDQAECPPGSGIYCTHNDDGDGGTLSFSFPGPVQASSVRLIDSDSTDGTSTVVLTDSDGFTRTYSVPTGWTGDRCNAPPEPGMGDLDLDTLAPQPGFAAAATASEQAGFNPAGVVRIDVNLAGSGGVDDLTWCPTSLAFVERAKATTRNGSNVNPVTLTNWSQPIVGGSWVTGLDCRAHGSGRALLMGSSNASTGLSTAFGELLLGDGRFLLDNRPQAGSIVYFSLQVPHDLALIGLAAHAQGLCTGSPRAQLSNALDLVLGF